MTMRSLREHPSFLLLVVLFVWTVFWILIAPNLEFDSPQKIFYPAVLLTSIDFRSTLHCYLIPLFIAIVFVFQLRHAAGWRAKTLAALLAGLSIFLALLGVFIPFLETHSHKSTLVVGSHRYQLTQVNTFEFRCDPYCYPPDFVLFECDSFGVVCERIAYLSTHYYDEAGIFRMGVYPMRSVELEYITNTAEIAIVLNGEAIFKQHLTAQ